jgi:hypothetical protein
VDNRRFYEINIFFPDIDAMLRRISFPDIKETCHIRNWMCMPSMGDPIANAFNCPVFFFSQSISQTFFPTRCPPNNNTPIFIAFTSSHFVVVWLKNPLLFPAPILQIDWEVAAEPEALEWKKKYAKCFDLTETLKAAAPPNKYKDY